MALPEAVSMRPTSRTENPVRQSAQMLAASMTFAYRALSPFLKAPNWSGVLVKTDAPQVSILSFTSFLSCI